MKASIVARHPITIGKDAIVGACSLVNKSIPSNSVAVGVPIRVINENTTDITSQMNRERDIMNGGEGK